MRLLSALFILVVAAAAPTAAVDELVTIRKLAVTCGDQHGYDKGFCSGYVKALLEFRAAYDNAYRTRQTYCIPAYVTREQLQKRFVAWAGEDSSRHAKPALWGVSRSLRDNYPC